MANGEVERETLERTSRVLRRLARKQAAEETGDEEYERLFRRATRMTRQSVAILEEQARAKENESG